MATPIGTPQSPSEASVADESQNSSGRLVAARVAALEASHQAEVNELKRAPWCQLVRTLKEYLDVHPRNREWRITP